MTHQADYPFEVMQATGALLKSNDQQEEIIICGGIDLTTITDKEREIMKKESGKKHLCILQIYCSHPILLTSKSMVS